MLAGHGRNVLALVGGLIRRVPTVDARDGSRWRPAQELARTSTSTTASQRSSIHPPEPRGLRQRQAQTRHLDELAAYAIDERLEDESSRALAVMTRNLARPVQSKTRAARDRRGQPSIIRVRSRSHRLPRGMGSGAFVYGRSCRQTKCVAFRTSQRQPFRNGREMATCTANRRAAFLLGVLVSCHGRDIRSHSEAGEHHRHGAARPGFGALDARRNRPAGLGERQRRPRR